MSKRGRTEYKCKCECVIKRKEKEKENGSPIKPNRDSTPLLPECCPQHSRNLHRGKRQDRSPGHHHWRRNTCGDEGWYGDLPYIQDRSDIDSHRQRGGDEFERSIQNDGARVGQCFPGRLREGDEHEGR